MKALLLSRFGIGIDVVMLENFGLLTKSPENNKILNFEIPEIKFYRNDDIEIRKWIMSLTPEDRKRLKINKSTLWYRQKAIKDGKKVKIYSKEN